ncbi:glycosyltransferase [Mycolicibacterium sp. PAM1]|uniref:glycosyltransferase n=1 Tax=Mycolicibacterium sp. PAM1 TaxID=2853535 RepID=UPI001C3E60BA|nr:glycosyltransferase [Mycolicibacterium sp. PAM1]MBV5245385.1 glycosyltransferase [Mycolicibacterium sp. PAM1]
MHARPHICILGINYPPEPTGIAPYTGGLAAGLAAAGHRVTAHVAHPHYPEWRILSGYGQWTRGELIDGVDVRRRWHFVPSSPRGLRRLLSELSFGVRLTFARWGAPQLVIAVSPALFSTALAMLRLRLTPRGPHSIVWVQDIYSLGLTETGEGSGLVLRITKWVEGRVLRSADQVVVIHQRFADYVTSKLGVSPSRVAVVRNWTHLQPSATVDPAAAKATLGWTEAATIAVHTGNMGAKQGLQNIVEAARLADEHDVPVHFILVGDGGERNELEELAQGVLRLTFVDPLADAEYRLALGAADVLIVNEKPGVSAMAMPSKLTSYFDAGRPVVAATDRNGITASEVTEADAGLVIPAGDPRALLDAVLMMRANPEEAARFGANGRRHRDHFLNEATAIEHWASLANSSGTR